MSDHYNISSSSESDDEEEKTRDFEKGAKLIIGTDVLPTKSVTHYQLVYDTFINWQEENKASSFDESVFICYFKDIKKKVNPATSWCVWSMLRSMLLVKHNIDITKYANLRAILKNRSKGHKPKKSLVFTNDQ